MLSSFDAALGLLAIHDARLAQRMQRTVEWVEESLTVDGVPDWCARMVLDQVRNGLLYGTFPVLPEERKGSEQ